MTTKPTLSASRIEMYRRCGMQYYFRYIEGIKVPPGVAAYVGTATHKSIERNLTAKRDAGSLLSIEEISETAADALNANWLAEEPLLSPEERETGADKVQGEAVDSAVRLSKLHHAELAPMITPVHLERYFRLDLKNYPYDLDGFIDIQEPAAVRDTKTSSKSPAADTADNSTQLTIYSLAVHVIDVMDVPLRLDYLINSKSPKTVTLTSTRDNEDYRRLLLTVEKIASAIDAGVFVPTSPDSWCCCSRYCGFYERHCPFGAKKKVQF